MYSAKVLVACECYGKVRDAFLAKGISAVSCDLKADRSGAEPEFHYQGDLFDGTLDLESYQLIIAHPPCTAICNAGNHKYQGTQERQDGVAFFKRIWDIPVKMMCIENPVGCMNTYFPSRAQLAKPFYIQPYDFGHPATKRTGLWLRYIPPLRPTRTVTPHPSNHINNLSGKGEELREARSITYTGIAQAMAEQWSRYIK